MKKLFSLFTLALVLVFSSCIEQNYPLWKGALVEFQDAVVRTPVTGQKYPRITVNNSVGTISLQVNLVGAQRSSDEIIAYSIVQEGTTAVSGTDFTTSGNVTINVVDTGRIGGFVDLLLQLDGNANIGSSQNYNQVQIRINRPAPPAEGA